MNANESLFETRDWAQILNALLFYGDERNWHEDDWGVLSVLAGKRRGEGYGKPHIKARKASDAAYRLSRRFQGLA